MSEDVNASLQRDRQWAAEDTDAIHEAIEQRLMSVNTSCPGIVQSFDRAKLTAVVKPVHDMLWLEDDGTVATVPYPLCTDVPVVFPQGGGVGLFFDVAAGDECILHFSQRCIDEWWQLGGSRVPGEHRFHDASDAMAVVGISSQPRAAQLVGGVSAGCAELRTLDGATVVRVQPGLVTLGDAGSAGFLALASKVKDALDAIKTHTHGSNGGGPIVASPELATLATAVAASNVKGS
jgi:hypothetical protein